MYLLCSSFNQGFCFWNNLRDDDFDWTRGTKGTPSVSTGPKSDHTTGGTSGMEFSSILTTEYMENIM